MDNESTGRGIAVYCPFCNTINGIDHSEYPGPIQCGKCGQFFGVDDLGKVAILHPPYIREVRQPNGMLITVTTDYSDDEIVVMSALAPLNDLDEAMRFGMVVAWNTLDAQILFAAHSRLAESITARGLGLLCRAWKFRESGGPSPIWDQHILPYIKEVLPAILCPENELAN